MGDMKHVAWPMENGAPSRIGALGQSRDGYLWVGSVEGLFRFDGLTFEPIRPAMRRDGPFVVSSIFGASTGDVWVGLARSGGAMIYRRGRLIDARLPDPSREVTGIVETPDHAIWVARGGRNTRTLARFANGRWEEIGREWGLPQSRIWQLLRARDGTLWAVLSAKVVRLRPGARRFEDSGADVMWRASIAEDETSRIWVSDGDGPRLLRRSTGTDYPRSGRPPDSVLSTKILFDARGRLWGSTVTTGLFRIDAPEAPRATSVGVRGFGAAEGLTSDQARSVFLDREGNLWIGTELGLDLLRPASVAVATEIAADSPESYHVASVNGTVYVTDIDTLYRIRSHGSPEVVARFPALPSAMCGGKSGTLWITFRDHALRYKPRGGVERIAKPISSTYYGCAEDAAGRLWLPAVDGGLLWRDGARWRRWPGLGTGVGVPGDAATMPDGRAAILFRDRPPALPAAPFVALSKERVGIGNLEGLLPTSAALFVSGSRGFAAVSASGVRRLDAARYPWLASVNGLVRTPAGDIWTIGDAGIVRMRAADLDRALARPGAAIPHRVFDFNDGVNSFAQKASGAQAAVGGDGRIWFLTRRNVLMIDPANLRRNPLPPPVLIRSATFAGRTMRDPGAITLPAGTTRLSIGYTATSLSIPSRVRFRYRVEGQTPGWVDPGGRRTVDLADLGPGTYRFHVIASNEDGVWNREGAALRFTIPPTLAQTWPFRLAAVIAFGLLLWLLYSLRLKQVSGRIRERLEARSSERERIARDLHDTLLQGVQGLIMRFHAISVALPEADKAKGSIDGALDRAEELLVEGRERVRDLRRREGGRLDQVLSELVAAQQFDAATKVDVRVTGTPRPVCGTILDEIASVVGEALFNAARHARASSVEILGEFTGRHLNVTVRDDGVGFDHELAGTLGRSGHFGLVGMRERARRIGATLEIEGAPGEGTTVSLRIPATIAYDSDVAAGPARWISFGDAFRRWRRRAIDRDL